MWKNRCLFKSFLWVTAFLACLTICASSQAATYYVDRVSGNDAEAGTSRDTPLKTIQSAADRTVPGDTCVILSGSYNERVFITQSGAPGQPILYQAEGDVITRGFTILADYIHIADFEITDTADHWREGAGIHLEGKYGEITSNYIHDVTRVGIQVWAEDKDSPETSDCKVIGNRIERASLAGIEIYGRNHLVEGNDISHTLQYPPAWKDPPYWVDADGMRFFGSGHVIRGNNIRDISLADPENVDPHIDCFQTWGPAYNIVFEQNFCENLNDGMQGFMIHQFGSPVKDLIIRNNIIKAFRFVNVWNGAGIIIVNNTFKSELFYREVSNYGIELHDSPHGKVMNNLILDVGRHEDPYLYFDSGSQPVDVGYNAHYMSDGTAPAGNPWPNDLWQVDPKLANISSNDFHLLPGSPLVNAGAELAEVRDDFKGTPRPHGLSHDIGAFEFRDEEGGTVSPREVILRLQELASFVVSLESQVFKTFRAKNRLTNELKSVLSKVATGKYETVLKLLGNGVLRKVDGCISSSEPDRDDWIRDCGVQDLFYEALSEIMAMINHLLMQSTSSN